MTEVRILHPNGTLVAKGTIQAMIIDASSIEFVCTKVHKPCPLDHEFPPPR